MTFGDGVIAVQYISEDPANAVIAAFEDDATVRVKTAASFPESSKLEGVDCIVSARCVDGRHVVDFLETVEDATPTVVYDRDPSGRTASNVLEAGAADYIDRRSGDGEPARLQARVRDAIKDAQAVARLRAAHRQFAELAATTQDVFWIFSADWSVVEFANRAHENVFSQSITALQDHPTSFLNCVHPEDFERVRTAMKRASNGERTQVTYRVDDSESTQRWVESRCRPVTDVNGDVIRLVGTTRDITEQKSREEELRKANERLDEFASTLAHDLRNPLSVADGALELARAESASDELDTVATALDRTNAIVDNLLTLACGEDITGSIETVSLDDLAEASAEAVPMDDATLAVDGDLSIECDFESVREIFENLYRNAVEYGGDDVTIRVGPLPIRSRLIPAVS